MSVFSFKVLVCFMLTGITPCHAHNDKTQQQCQRSDSMLVNQLREDGVSFSHDNSVTLLMTGQEKFDDLFKAIKQARSSVHLEYFNFRNDSIARCLFDLLAEKAAQGVKVRAMFDGFGNDSNNRPLRRKHIKSYARKASRSTSLTRYAFLGSTMSGRAITEKLWSSTVKSHTPAV